MLQRYRAANPRFIDTYEAYSDLLFIGRNNLVIPYVNIGLMANNPINGKQSVIDYSYYVFKDIRSITFSISERKVVMTFSNKSSSKNLIADHIGVGGYKNSNWVEVETLGEEIEFLLPNSSKINEPFHPFLPIDTPTFKRSLSTEIVESFFLPSSLPNEIIELIGANFISLGC